MNCVQHERCKYGEDIVVCQGTDFRVCGGLKSHVKHNVLWDLFICFNLIVNLS